MQRPPLAVALAVLSAILILGGRLNRGLLLGTPALIVGFVLLVAAGVIFIRAQH